MTERERLIELLGGKNGFTEEDNDVLADYLLENGVAVMPVDMIGKTLWFLNCDDNIICDKISGFVVSDKHDIYFFLQKAGYDAPCKLSEIGKDLFLTREEAENALNEQKK